MGLMSAGGTPLKEFLSVIDRATQFTKVLIYSEKSVRYVETNTTTGKYVKLTFSGNGSSFKVTAVKPCKAKVFYANIRSDTEIPVVAERFFSEGETMIEKSGLSNGNDYALVIYVL